MKTTFVTRDASRAVPSSARQTCLPKDRATSLSMRGYCLEGMDQFISDGDSNGT